MVIYETENLINGKKYIGKDSQNNPTYLGSGKYLKLAIKKYGRANFKKTILEECNSLEELNSREIYWLKLKDCKNNPQYYNATDTITPCRTGQTLTKEHRERISISHRGKIMPAKTAEAIRKQVESRRNNGTLQHSEETKAKISKSNTGKPKSLEHRLAMSRSRLGKKTQPHSEETKKKISEGQKKKPILRLDKETLEVLSRYESIKSVSEYGYNPWSIQAVLRGKNKTSGGFSWKYEE